MPNLIDAASEDVLAALSRQLSVDGHNVVAFVGAGMSRQGGLPLWSELMRSLDEEVQKFRPSRADQARKAVSDHVRSLVAGGVVPAGVRTWRSL